MQDIPGGVDISIKDKTALRTPMQANTQFLGNDTTTAGARLTGVPWVNCDHSRTSLFRFVREVRQQLTPPGVVDALGKFGATETVNVQVFNRNQGEPINQLATELVGHIPALIGNLAVRFGNLLASLVPAAGELFAARQPALLLSQLPLGLAEVARGLGGLAGREGCQGRNATVDADRPSAERARRGVGEVGTGAGR